MSFARASISGVSYTHLSSLTVDTEINQGWRGQVSFTGKPSITFADMDLCPVTFADKFGNDRTVQMLAKSRSKTFSVNGGWSGSFDLLDPSSYKLSTGGLSFDTFSNCTMADIVAAVADACDVTVTNAPTFPVWKEDVKNADGWSVMRRAAIVSGQQLEMSEAGVLTFRSSSYVGASSGDTYFETETATNSPLDRYSRLFVAKNLGAGTLSPEQYYDFHEPGYLTNQTMVAPLSNCVPYDMSSNGYIGWVGFWDSDDRLIVVYPLGGGEADGYTEDFLGEWPAVKFSLYVYPQTVPEPLTNCRLRILGIPPITFPADVDPALAAYYGSGRCYTQPFTENLIPGASYAAAHYLDWLAEINRHTFTIESQGIFQIGESMLAPHTFDGHSGRVEKLSFDMNAGEQGYTQTTEVSP